jgi:hypothetical protein
MAHRALLCCLVSLALVSLCRPARACACVDWPPERRMAEAERIFIGRTAAQPSEAASEFVQFTVIETLKGTPMAHFDLQRVSDDCERSFNRGELALVFVVKGHAPTCAGNVDLDALMPTLGQYMGGEGGEGGGGHPDLEALKLALAGKVHGAKTTVYSAGMAGKSVRVGSTLVSFVDKRADELLSAGGVTHGPITYVALRAPDQVATYVLLGRDKGKLTILSTVRKDLKIK